MRNAVKDQRGSALVTVMIMVGFISILATTLMYVSGMNYRMKVADNKIKTSFYNTEESVDEIRANVVILVSETMKEVYPEMMASMGSSINQADVQVTFQNIFYRKLNKKLSQYVATIPTGSDKIFKNPDGNAFAVVMVNDKIEIQNIIAEEKNSNGYTSKISTSIVIQAPEVDWPYTTAKALDANATTYQGPRIDYYGCVYYSNWVKK